MSDAQRARRVAVAVWRQRRRVERQAAQRFERLARELAGVGADAAVIALAQTAAEDERRHAALCETLVVHFGGAPSPPDDAVVAAPIGIRGMTKRQRVLFEVVAMSCVTETLSTALLGALVERASDPHVYDTMHSILRDEIQHSRLGWAHLAAEHAAGASDIVGVHLPAMLEATVRDELFSGDGEHDLQDRLSGMGALSRGERLDTFCKVMTTVVFPGLQRFGVDVGPAHRWLAERTRPGVQDTGTGPRGHAAKPGVR